MQVDFDCLVPKRALAEGAGKARPSLYGHGLFGGYGEIHQDQIKAMEDEHDFILCATAWAGMATEDVPNVATILADLSNFPTLADRVQQGMLNFLYLGRLMIHPDGLGANPAFQTADGKSLLDTRRLYYDGNSQGGIIGGALTAVAPDFNRATLGVLGMNYSTLLTRSTDFGTGDQHAVADARRPDQRPRVRLPALPGLPAAQRAPADLRADADAVGSRRARRLRAAHDERPVPEHAAATTCCCRPATATTRCRTTPRRSRRGRSARACSSATCCGRGRAWERHPWWGLKPVDPAHTSGVSVFTVWDGGSRPSPLGNVAQDNTYDDDPHEWVRRTPAARAMKSAFLSLDSRIVDTCVSYCDTYNYPFASRRDRPCRRAARPAGRRGACSDGASRITASARAPGARWPTSVRRSARAPPSVAAVSASSAVMCMSRTASAMQNAIEVV